MKRSHKNKISQQFTGCVMLLSCLLSSCNNWGAPTNPPQELNFANKATFTVNLKAEYDENMVLMVWDSYVKEQLRVQEVQYFFTDNQNKQEEYLPTLFKKDGTGMTPQKALTAGLLVNVSGKLYKNGRGESVSVCGPVDHEVDPTIEPANTDLGVAIFQIEQWNIKQPGGSDRLITKHIIIFPYHITATHWALGVLELELSRNNTLNRAEVKVFNPLPSCGGNKVSKEAYEFIQGLLRKSSFSLPNKEVTLVSKDSHHRPQQNDGVSCGAIVAENGKMFLAPRSIGEDKLQKTYSSGAEDLRQQHLQEVLRVDFYQQQRTNRVYKVSPEKKIDNYQEFLQAFYTGIKSLGVEDQEAIQRITQGINDGNKNDIAVNVKDFIKKHKDQFQPIILNLFDTREEDDWKFRDNHINTLIQIIKELASTTTSLQSNNEGVQDNKLALNEQLPSVDQKGTTLARHTQLPAAKEHLANGSATSPLSKAAANAQSSTALAKQNQVTTNQATARQQTAIYTRALAWLKKNIAVFSNIGRVYSHAPAWQNSFQVILQRFIGHAYKSIPRLPGDTKGQRKQKEKKNNERDSNANEASMKNQGSNNLPFSEKLKYLYAQDDTLPKLVEDDLIPEQNFKDYYVKLQVVLESEKKLVEIAKIFDKIDEHHPAEGKVILLGKPGAGKSTLMHYISYQWAKANLWKGKFDHVFRVRLKELSDPNWLQNYGPKDKNDSLLACFIHNCLDNQATNLQVKGNEGIEEVKYEYLKKIKKLLKDQPQKVLLLVDGYDEVTSLQNTQVYNKVVNLGVFKHPQVIMASRHNAVSNTLREQFKRQIEIQGLDNMDIQQYIHLYFERLKQPNHPNQSGQPDPQKQEENLQAFLVRNNQLMDVCKVPINIALLCHIWQVPDIRAKFTENLSHQEEFKLGQLYDALVMWLGERYLTKHDPSHNNPAALKELTQDKILDNKVFKALVRVAYEMSKNINNIVNESGYSKFPGTFLSEIAKKEDFNLKISDLQKYGLLRGEGNPDKPLEQTYEFIHLTFQEYLCACRLHQLLSQEDQGQVKEVVTWIADHRNDPKYLMTLKFLAGLVSQRGNRSSVQRFWEAVSCNVDSGWELGTEGKVHLLMHLLGQRQIGSKLDQYIPNLSTMQEFIDEVVLKDTVQWQQGIIESGYVSESLTKKINRILNQAKIQRSVNERLLRAAASIAVSMVNKGVFGTKAELLDRFIGFTHINNWQIQKLGLEKAGQVVDKDIDRQYLLGSTIEQLYGLLSDANLQQAVTDLLAKLAQTYTTFVLSQLQKLVPASDAKMKGCIATTLPAIFKALPREFVHEALSLLKLLLHDENNSVRSSAASALSTIVLALAKEETQAAWDLLKRMLNDEKSYVRYNATKTLGAIIPTLDKENMQAALHLLKPMLGDKERLVRLSANSALEAIVVALVNEEWVWHLLQPLLSDEENCVRLSATKALRQAARIFAKEEIQAEGDLLNLKMLRDEEWVVRSSATDVLETIIQTFGKEEIQTAWDLLNPMLKNKEGYVRLSATKALAAIVPTLTREKFQAAWDLLKTLLKDKKSSNVRSSAAKALEAMIEGLPFAELVSISSNDPDQDIRKMAKETLINKLKLTDRVARLSHKEISCLIKIMTANNSKEALEEDLCKEANKALHHVADNMNSDGIQWVNEHVTTFPKMPEVQAFLKSILHKILRDGVINEDEAKLMVSCIVKRGITMTIDVKTNKISLEGKIYQLDPSSNSILEWVVNEAIKTSQDQDIVAKQYKAHRPSFKNSGSALPVATADIEQVGSIVNDAELQSAQWYLSVMDLTDQYWNKPSKTFLLLEQRKYTGDHIIYQIATENGHPYVVCLHQVAVGTTELREKIFGKMEYIRVKPRYYGASFEISQEQGEKLLQEFRKGNSSITNSYEYLHDLANQYVSEEHQEYKDRLNVDWGKYVQESFVTMYKKDELLKVEAIQVQRDSYAIDQAEQVSAMSKQVEQNSQQLQIQGQVIQIQGESIEAVKAEVKTNGQQIRDERKKLVDVKAKVQFFEKRSQEQDHQLQGTEKRLQKQEQQLQAQRGKTKAIRAQWKNLDEQSKRQDQQFQDQEVRLANLETTKGFRDQQLLNHEIRLGAVEAKVDLLEDILKISGIKEDAEIRRELSDYYKVNDKALFNYCTTFIWTLKSYLDAYAIANSGFLATNKESSKKEKAGVYTGRKILEKTISYIPKIAEKGLAMIPVIGEIADLLLVDATEATYEYFKDAKQSNKIAVINQLLHQDHTWSNEVEHSIAKTALEIVRLKKADILAPPMKSKSGLTKLASSISDKLSKLTDKLIKNYQLGESPQTELAVQDVVLLMANLYAQYDALQANHSGKLYEQMANLVCKGNLVDVIANSFPSASSVKLNLTELEKVFKVEIENENAEIKNKARQGQWEKLKLHFEEKYIIKRLKKAQASITEENIVASQIVLFKAMNDGVLGTEKLAMEERKKALECASAFGKRYPVLTELIAKAHPECFVDMAIAKRCLQVQSLPADIAQKLPSTSKLE